MDFRQNLDMKYEFKSPDFFAPAYVSFHAKPTHIEMDNHHFLEVFVEYRGYKLGIPLLHFSANFKAIYHLVRVPVLGGYSRQGAAYVQNRLYFPHFSTYGHKFGTIGKRIGFSIDRYRTITLWFMTLTLISSIDVFLTLQFKISSSASHEPTVSAVVTRKQ